MAEKKSGILKNTLVIFIVTLVAVALLAVVNLGYNGAYRRGSDCC